MTPSRRDECTVRLAKGEVQCEREGEVVWTFRIADLRLVGEWTTDHGPWGEDYFYGFAAGQPATWYEVPLGAATGLLAELERALDECLKPGLAGSTDFSSRVIWPKHLEGHALFEYSPEARPEGLLNRGKDVVLPLIHSSLTKPVLEYLAGPPANKPLPPTIGTEDSMKA